MPRGQVCSSCYLLSRVDRHLQKVKFEGSFWVLTWHCLLDLHPSLSLLPSSFIFVPFWSCCWPVKLTTLQTLRNLSVKKYNFTLGETVILMLDSEYLRCLHINHGNGKIDTFPLAWHFLFFFHFQVDPKFLRNQRFAKKHNKRHAGNAVKMES